MGRKVTSGFFTSLGETEKDKEALETRKAQWRRELGTGAPQEGSGFTLSLEPLMVAQSLGALWMRREQIHSISLQTSNQGVG